MTVYVSFDVCLTTTACVSCELVGVAMLLTSPCHGYAMTLCYSCDSAAIEHGTVDSCG